MHIFKTQMVLIIYSKCISVVKYTKKKRKKTKTENYESVASAPVL